MKTSAPGLPLPSLAYPVWGARKARGAKPLAALLTCAELLALLAAGCDYPPLPQAVVFPGQSIQAALNRIPATAESWVIQVKPGIYHETLSVDHAGVSLIGEVTGTGTENRPVLDGTVDGGPRLLTDAVLVSGAHFTMQGFTVRNYSGSGVTTSKTHHVYLHDIFADHTGRYGLSPVESEDVIIDSCVATGNSDAGIHVSQSRRATVQNCLVYANVAGLEIENTVDALVTYNTVFGNTAGLLAFVLPGKPSKLGQDCTVLYNDVHDNNLKNWGDPAALVSKVPAGLGIAVMAADGTVVQENNITGNRSVGVAIIGLDLLVTAPTGSDVEPNPDTTVLRNNNYANNGKDPDPALKAKGFMTGGDILWDSKGEGELS